MSINRTLQLWGFQISTFYEHKSRANKNGFEKWGAMLRACYSSKGWASTSQNSAAVHTKRNPPHSHEQRQWGPREEQRVHLQHWTKTISSFSGCILKQFVTNLCPKNVSKCKESQNRSAGVPSHPCSTRFCERQSKLHWFKQECSLGGTQAATVYEEIFPWEKKVSCTCHRPAPEMEGKLVSNFLNGDAPWPSNPHWSAAVSFPLPGGSDGRRGQVSKRNLRRIV